MKSLKIAVSVVVALVVLILLVYISRTSPDQNQPPITVIKDTPAAIPAAATNPEQTPNSTPTNNPTPAQTAAPVESPTPENISGPKPFMLGKVAIFLKDGRIELSGKIKIRQNIIELLASTESGRAYESLTVVDCAPTDLQAALILLGLEYHGGPQYLGDPTPPKGDPLRLFIEWKDAKGKIQHHGIESMITDKKAGGAMKPVEWVFSGSRMIKDEGTGKDVFGAESSGTVITTYHDPDAIIDNPSTEGGNDENWEAKTEAIPPEDTAIKLIIQSVKHLKQEPEKDKPADDAQK